MIDFDDLMRGNLVVDRTSKKTCVVTQVGEFVRLDGCLSYRFKNELDPDINREEFCKGLVDTSSWDGGSKKHNSLWDAYVIRECYKLLMK